MDDFVRECVERYETNRCVLEVTNDTEKDTYDNFITVFCGEGVTDDRERNGQNSEASSGSIVER